MDRARRERDERTTAKRPEAMGGGRRREPPFEHQQHQVHCTGPALWPRTANCKEADRRTMEETREGRKNGRQKVKAIDGGKNRARGLCVRATERWRRGACERQKGGKIERDG